MVQLNTARAANTALFQSRPFVAVFAGATSGIGEATLRALAAAHGTNGKGLRVYVIGRKKEATEKILAECVKTCPNGKLVFVQASDLSLLEEVDRVCAEITKAEKDTVGTGSANIDLLCMSQGDFNFSPRRDTKEGLEFRVSLLYYSRMRIIVNLLPLLLASELPAHIISVFAGGKESDFHLEDISLRDPQNWSSLNIRSHVAMMHTFFFEYLVTQHPGKLSFVHLYPGLVMTNAFMNPGVPWWARIGFRVFYPFFRLASTPIGEAGERVLFLASPQRFPASQGTGDATAVETKLAVANGTDGREGSGAYGVNIDGETSHNAKAIEKYRAEGLGGKITEHTMKVFEVISSGKVWTE
ncbi:hypothetical protein H2200_013481 [Cladophialophora chaetospira]|uniref:Uncharacterized protein n=1 Tax=Cladophialophora chaetospira TaxID=386627 RepID=A0AA38U9N9_9EURO|nr:hypothetical protein H2200_013481 [Cladophialophora chaetospira]